MTLCPCTDDKKVINFKNDLYTSREQRNHFTENLSCCDKNENSLTARAIAL